MEDKITFADLFAGCGGLSFGFHSNPSYKQILATDIWLQAKQTYMHNYPSASYQIADLRNESDLNSIINQLREVDLIIGGPPCKGFSTLNNSKKESKFNTLVDQYLKVVIACQPDVFLIENVRGFKSKKHPNGSKYPDHVKNFIEKESSNYTIIDFELNAYDYGIPQSRVRYFMIGLKDCSQDEVSVQEYFDSLFDDKKSNKKKVLKDAIGDLPKVSVRGGSNQIDLANGRTLYNHKSMNHSKALEERLKHVKKNGGLMDVPKNLLTPHLRRVVDGKYGSGGFTKNIYGRMNWDKPSGTIVAGMDKITIGRFVHPEENRLLTPRECARIQSYPDEFVFLGGMVSQYYQIGNSVPPLLSSIFADILKEYFHSYADKSFLSCN